MEPTRIYLVEDQPLLLKALVKALTAYPELAIVGTAQEGESAVEEIVAYWPALIDKTVVATKVELL